MLKSSFLLITALLAIAPAAQALSVHSSPDWKVAQTGHDKLSTFGETLISQVSQNDFMVAEGRGGYINPANQAPIDFYYKLFQKSSNSWYELYVWTLDGYENKSGFIFRQQFPTSRQALDYFDCKFGNKAIFNCEPTGVRSKYIY